MFPASGLIRPEIPATRIVTSQKERQDAALAFVDFVDYRAASGDDACPMIPSNPWHHSSLLSSD
jgi:hypothetical protein